MGGRHVRWRLEKAYDRVFYWRWVAADLLTLRGRDLIASRPVCLYAGSLIPKAVLGIVRRCAAGQHRHFGFG